MIKTREKYAKKADRIETRCNPRVRLPLRPQLVVHDNDILEPTIRPISNDAKTLSKPRGGLWTSTYDADYGSGWVRWCVAYRYNEPLDLHWTVVSVSSTAKVAIIDSAADFAGLINRYPRLLHGRRGLNFERLAQDYDAVHLTHEGYLKSRSPRSGPRLIGWDCESTLWFRWVFSESHKVQPCFKDADRFDDLWLSFVGLEHRGLQMPSHAGG